jgi:hypothetical protein
MLLWSLLNMLSPWEVEASERVYILRELELDELEETMKKLKNEKSLWLDGLSV